MIRTSVLYDSGADLDLYAFDGDGLIWDTDGEEFEAVNPASITDYAIAMAEIEETGLYQATLPTWPDGAYMLVVRERAGALPAWADVVVGSDRIYIRDGQEVTLAGTLAANVLQVAGEDVVQVANVVNVTGALQVSVQPLQAGARTIVQGDSYLNEDGNALLVTKAANALWPTDLSGWTIHVAATRNADKATDGDEAFAGTANIVTSTGDGQAVRFDLPAATTEGLGTGPAAYTYQVYAENGTSRVTLEMGLLTVRRKEWVEEPD